MNDIIRLHFVTDIHGSDVCFRKLLASTKSKKQANVLVIGGDITGKIVVPIVRQARGGWTALTPEWSGECRSIALQTKADVERFEIAIADRGEYAFHASVEEVKRFSEDVAYNAEVVERLQCQRLRRWLEMASERLSSDCQLYINAGNDDGLWIDKVLDSSSGGVRPEGQVVDIGGGLTMISTGYTNMTPWHCPRDVPDHVLAAKIEDMACRVPEMRRCLFNFHAPPVDSTLDRAKALKDFRPQMSVFGPEEQSVGSVAVRRAIERFQPVVSLHGHVHECHAFQRFGNTLSFNPGTEYKDGRLAGVYLEFQRGELKKYGLTREGG